MRISGKTRISRALAFAAAVTLFGFAPVQAEDAYPSRRITLVIPYAPGGLADLVARQLAVPLERNLKQPIIILNKPGASGALGAQQVAGAAPDGYTLLVTLDSISTLPVVNEILGQPVLFTHDQFDPIARLTADPCVLFVKTGAPWKTFGEFIADAKRRPDAITYSSSGQFGPTHIPMEMLTQATGTKLLHVPASGGGPAMTLLLGGHVDAFFTVPALGASHVESGALRPLAVSGDKRIVQFPSVPTTKELGAEIDYVVWAGLFAPKNLPANVRKTLAAAVKESMADPSLRASVEKSGSTLAYLGPDDFRAWWNHENSLLAGVLKKINTAAK